jgi:polyisoprenoid-binding protein YceI
MLAAARHFCQASRMLVRLAPALAAAPPIAMLCVAPVFAASATYRFDPVHSQIWFTVDHQRFSHPQGRVPIERGWFSFDENDWSASRVDVTLDVAGVDLGDAEWDRAVRSRQFLDAERWPEARYVGERVERTGEATGVIHGRLTFRGVTKPLDVAFTVNRVGNDSYAHNRRKVGVSATATLDRFAFGVDRFRDVVGATIALRLEIEGVRDRAAGTVDQEHAHGDAE